MANMSGQDWENQPSGGQTTTSDPYPNQMNERGLGPFQASVWEPMGSVDAWGLPKISAYFTSLSNGKEAIALQIGEEWHVFSVNSKNRAVAGWKWIVANYNYKNILGGL